jgi:carboxypeptidase family protein
MTALDARCHPVAEMMPHVPIMIESDGVTHRPQLETPFWAVFALLGLLVGVCVGCGRGESPVQPTPPPPPPVEFSLFGSVVDTAIRPLSDVRVEVVDGPRAGTFVTTTASGTYELPGVFTDSVTVQASRDGFDTGTMHVGGQSGRRYLEIYLQPGTPSVTMTGDYTISFSSDASCSALPDEVRTRTYNVTMTPGSFAGIPNQYGAVLGGATFFPSVGSNTFSVHVAGTEANLSFGDPYDDGTSIVEEVGPSTYLAIWGGGVLSVGGATISGSFDGTFQYCPSSTSSHGSGNIYGCPVQSISCSSKSHTVTLTRR